MYRVGVIGLGKMGLPIALNLMERGFAVIGYRRQGSPELASAGGEVASSPAEVAASANVLLSILPDIAALNEVVSGENGTLTACKPGTVHIEMSTIAVEDKGRVRDAVASRGTELLDCPISGSPGMVRPRLATTFASGERVSVDAVRPVLEAISGPWVYTGAFGTGASMKYIATMLMAVHTVAAAEAMVMARRCELDLELVQETLNNSIAASQIWKQRGPLMQQRAWFPAPGPITTLHDIIKQVADRAQQMGLATPMFSSAKAVFDQAVAAGWGELDIASVHDQLSGDSPFPAGDPQEELPAAAADPQG